MLYRNQSEDCIYLRAKRVLTDSPVTPTEPITQIGRAGAGGPAASSGLRVQEGVHRSVGGGAGRQLPGDRHAGGLRREHQL
eukprot:3612839-Pyramimonas_sp.AAC.2